MIFEKEPITESEFKVEIEKLHSHIIQKGLSRESVKKIVWLIENTPKKDILLLSLLSDLIDESRVFNYKTLYRDNFDIDLSHFETPIGELKKALYHYSKEIYLTPDQEEIIKEFLTCRRLIVSAPTSFGKSLLINRIIELTDYKNIALVVPTKALLYETSSRLMKQESIRNKYNIINSTITKDLKDRNILIMTPERLDSYLDEIDVEIDFFVVDEIYKVSNAEDDRNIVFSNIIYRLLKSQTDFYLIGPFFNDFSPRFREKYKAKFLRFDKSVVNHYFFDFYKLDDGNSLEFNGKKIKKFRTPQVLIRNVLSNCLGTSLVYIGNKVSCESQAKNYAAEVQKKQNVPKDNVFIDYLKSEISPDWTLLDCMKYGVAFHHGSMPKFIQVELVEMLNKGEISTIFCTPTIIEGVNTSAKNVIIADGKKGAAILTPLDKKNIYGRAGRFSKHFSGNVINISTELVSEDTVDFNIEFPLLDKDELGHDEIILLDDEDITDKNREKKNQLIEELKENNVPYSFIKSNKYVRYEKQLALINYLRGNTAELDLLAFRNLPSKESSTKALELCFDFLFSESDQEDSIFTRENLKRVTHYYIYLDSSYRGLKDKMGGEHENTKIRRMFKLINHYFEFVLPKCLKVLENIVNFVADETKKSKADFGAYIFKIEYGLAEEHEILMREFGFPPSLIKKLSSYFKDCNDPKSVIKKLEKIDLSKLKLHSYESGFLKNLLK